MSRLNPTRAEVDAVYDQLVKRGIHEVPGGSNRTVIGRIFGWNGVPWCAETVWVVFHVLKAAAMLNGKTASAELMRLNFRRKGRLHSNPQEGDIVFFVRNGQAYHVGRLRRFFKSTKSNGWVDEGNHSDALQRVPRNLTQGVQFGRPAYGSKRRRTKRVVVGGMALALAVGAIITPPKPAPKPAPKPPVSQPTTKPKPKPVVKPVVRLTNVRFKKTNGDVLDAERALRKKGGRGFKVDKTYTANTAKAMAKYQKRTNHKVNGKRPNAATLRSLGLRVR